MDFPPRYMKFNTPHPARQIWQKKSVGSSPASPLMRIAGWTTVPGCPLRYMYPQADIPVVQFAIQPNDTPEAHFNLGRQLTSLREDGVLIMALRRHHA
jgi:hypothetical protein